MNTKEQKDIYDMIYTKNRKYNKTSPVTYKKALQFLKPYKGKRILDAGCGAGNLLSYLKDAGHNIYGIEISSVCYNKYLKGKFRCENTDIVSFAAKKEKFDALICSGVLEHIPKEDLKNIITSLASLSSNALLSIANHSDIQYGVELHIVQEGPEWWLLELRKYYKTVSFEGYGHNKRLFYFICRS